MKRRILLAFALLLTAPVLAQNPSEQPAGYGPPITMEAAREMIDAGIARAEAQGLDLAFAVVEPSGELVAFARMDDVPYASIRIAQQKARTAARFRLTTAQFEERVQTGRVVLLSTDEVIAVGGGVPIIADGRVIGALGVSGATAAQDAAVAEAIAGGG